KIPENARVFVSHAHSYHTRGFRHKGLKQSTVETKNIHSALNRHTISNFIAIDLNRNVSVDGVEIRALNAGHMLGSAQFLVHTPMSSILYTGDINCVDTLTTRAAEPHRCDVLVIAETYCAPIYRFPSPEAIYDGRLEWA